MALNPEIIAQIGTSEEKLTKLLIKDVNEVFSSMVGLDDLLYIPHVVDPVSHFDSCITAMVGLAGSYNGMLSLHIPHSLALSFTSQMLCMEVSEINADVHDALGEIANMIAGSLKHHFSNGGDDVRLSTPSVLNSKDYVKSANNPADTLTLLFDVDDEWFIVSVILEKG
jgi:chemotaxis protein CheX